MKKSQLKKLIAEVIAESSHLLSAEEVANLVQNNPVTIEYGLRVRNYGNAEEFLTFFAKNNPEKVYRPGRRENVYVAVDKPEVAKPRTFTPPAPLTKAQQDASMQRFYDDLKYKGD